MDPKAQKLQHQSESTITQDQSVASKSNQELRQFGSVEELLRFDAEQTTAPAEIADRLKVSVAKEEEAGRSESWWRRWFKGSTGGG